MAQTSQGGNAVAAKHVHFAYTDNGRFDQIDRYAAVQTLPLGPMDLQNPTGSFVAGTKFSYDGQDRLTGLLHTRDTDLPSLADYGWEFDAAGRLVEHDSADGTVTYGYDPRGQLETADYDWNSSLDESYVYDENGNRETAGTDTYTVGDHNRMTGDGTFSYEYDNEGNRTKRYVAGQPKTDVTVYAWDHRNRLVSITDYATEGDPATKEVFYTYDVHGRRIAKHIDDLADGTIDREERYVYDGDHIALRLVDADGDGTQQTLDLANRYLHGPAIDQVLADEQVHYDGVSDYVTDHV